MSQFDQRGQRVGKQMNVGQVTGGNIVNVDGDVRSGGIVAGGDVHVGTQNLTFVEELQGVLRQVEEAARKGDLDPDSAEDVAHALRKVEIEAKKKNPIKWKCLERLEMTRSVLEKIVSAGKSVAAIGTAIGLLIAKVEGWS